ncbi:MAG: aldolase/citrate lyase family protein, partial [SAR202 cluster bacterium]|nr:aldolase/citrate lyase family protein [SAR202 cluster bacterium]
INKAIELLDQGQPIYYTGGHTGANLSYEGGKSMSKTWADYVNVGMEHGAFDMAGLDEFMRGLIDGGPTNSGHRTPAVIVEPPLDGSSEDVVRANAWQFRQILARGAHGILMCHAETPGAVKAFVESCRYPFQTVGVGKGLAQGQRGSAGQASASQVWGVSVDDYLDKADPWPLNPDGELMLGLKIENRRALVNVEATTRVPGISFAEWGPGDMSMSYGYKNFPGEPLPDELQEARERVRKACLESGIAFLEGMTAENAARKIDEGVKVGSAGVNGEEVARVGREHTGRTMPV